MLYMHINEFGEVDRVETAKTADYNKMGWARHHDGWARRHNGTWGVGWLNRNDIDTLDVAERLAASATKNLGRLFIPTDATESTSPRYDVIEAPRVGDEVSKTFNGDYYPCGKIVSISKSLHIITTFEAGFKVLRFYRRKMTGSWIQSGGTWTLVPGVLDERNPHL